MNSVLVIIVTYNGIKWLEKCLKSIFQSSMPLDIIIIDNGSIDGTQEYVKNNYEQVRFVQNKENLGFGRANNVGLQYALDNKYDYVYLLNQDAWLMADTLDKLISVNKLYPEFGVLSPFQLQGNGKNLDVNFASGVCSYSSNSHIINDLYFNCPAEVYEVSNVMAAHWLISRDCLKKVGGFSPTFPHYGEDNNYANRVIFHGYKLGVVPNATAIHDREFRKDSKKKIMYLSYIANLFLMSNIHHAETNPLICLFIHSVIAGIKYASLIPLINMFRVLKSYRIIYRNKEISKGKCAFLV